MFEKKMKTILLFYILIFSNFCFSQTLQVTIIGNLPQQNGGEFISFSKPIGSFTTIPSIIDSKDNVILKNNKFTKTLEITEPGLIYVYEKPYKSTIIARFFAEPGDTIYIDRKNNEINFRGKNAIVNKMFSDVKLAPVAFNEEVYNVFKNNNSDKILSKIIAKETEYLKYYQELLLKNQISKSCYEYTAVIMGHCIANLTLNIALDENFRVKQKIHINKEDAAAIIDYFNLKYIQYNPENLKSLFFGGLIRKTALYLQEKALMENKDVPKFWNQFDNLFKSEIINIGVLDYIESEKYKEMAVGQYFIDLIKSYDNEKTVKYKDLILIYKVFENKFPSSSYIKPISGEIMDIHLKNLGHITPDIIKVESNIAVGSLAIYDKTLDIVSNSPFAHPNQALIDVLTEKFPNQDVFIDFWATWCGPCIKQFAYNKDLHNFLNTAKVKTLYITIDKEEDKIKWEKYIHDYNLTGFHFLANNNYRKKFIDTLGDYIPMYLLYNSKTKKLEKLEGTPSEKEKFYANITKSLAIN